MGFFRIKCLFLFLENVDGKRENEYESIGNKLIKGEFERRYCERGSI